MKSSIKLYDGEEWYLMYTYMNDHLLEIIPFQTDCFDKRTYLPDGRYNLLSGGFMDIKDKKIVFIQYEK